MRMLLIDDEVQFCRLLADALQGAGFEVDVCHDGVSAADYLALQAYDLVILDWLLPGRDGIEVLAAMRKGGDKTPVLMLTAMGAASNQVRGLDAGADDYLPKPFELEVLLAHVRALLRRPAAAMAENTAVAGDLSLDVATKLLSGPLGQCHLSGRECALLSLLIGNFGRAITREVLLMRVWGTDTDIGDGNIGNYVMLVRRRLEQVGSRLAIRTLRGIGYMLGEAGDA